MFRDISGLRQAGFVAHKSGRAPLDPGSLEKVSSAKAVAHKVDDMAVSSA